MFELCEETALLLYPWVFVNDNGYAVDKNLAVPYSELKNELFLECFDIVEEARVELDEDTIHRMFTESDVKIDEDLVAGSKIRLRKNLQKRRIYQ